ncbi:MAG: PAS domain S-box protein [Gammaproteobacteria bacterium]|nr:PAS domain S-box protein [Gammaproteobacteria bacterium]
MMMKVDKGAGERLRELAEQRAAERGPPGEASSRADAMSLIHDLQVHEIELELQNDELRRTQNDLDDIRERYQDLFDQAPIGYLLVDREGRLIEANGTMADLLGAAPRRLAGSELARWCSPDSQDTLHLHLKAACGDETGAQCEVTVVGAEAPGRRVRLITAPAPGAAEALRIAVVDISAQHRAEAALAASEQRYHEMFEHAPLPYLSMDEEGVILDVNQAWLATIGHDEKSEVVGRYYGDFQTAASRAEFEARLHEARATGKLHRVRLDLVRRDGTVLNTLADCSFVTDPVSRARVTQCIFADVTEQYRLLAELTQFRAMVDHSADGILTIDRVGGTVTDCNQGALRALGYEAGALVGMDAAALGIGPDCLAEGGGGDGAAVAECTLVRADGSRLPVELGVTPMPAPHEHLLLVVARDISERLEAEYQLRENRREIEQAHREWLAAFDALRDPIFLHDAEGWVLRANRAYAEEAGLSVAEVPGHPYWELFPRLSGPSPGCVQAFDDKDQRETEEELALPDGRIFTSRAGTIRDGEGHYRFSIHILTDITERRQHEAQLFQAMESTVSAISQAMEMRDPYTAGHQMRVARLAVAIGGAMGLSGSILNGLDFGGRIHDIGKIYIPAEILSRPGRLPPEEFALIKNHTTAGHLIIRDIDFPWPVAEMALQHHERLDGTGYPKGLEGDDIILEARIIAVADVVEAMTNHRPYRPALGLEQALDEVRAGRGVAFDADVVDACVALFEDGGFTL